MQGGLRINESNRLFTSTVWIQTTADAMMTVTEFLDECKTL
jgi:hypothetical protein